MSRHHRVPSSEDTARIARATAQIDRLLYRLEHDEEDRREFDEMLARIRKRAEGLL